MLARVIGMAVFAAACSQPRTETGSQTSAATARPAAPAPLACDGGSFTKFRLKNTKSRSYDAGAPSFNRCDLAKAASGVIWVAQGEGHSLAEAEKKLSFKDDQARTLEHTCWTSSGTINGVARTELILFGPADSRTVTVCCGAVCSEALVE
jgi:hypothetical protein